MSGNSSSGEHPVTPLRKHGIITKMIVGHGLLHNICNPQRNSLIYTNYIQSPESTWYSLSSIRYSLSCNQTYDIFSVGSEKRTSIWTILKLYYAAYPPYRVMFRDYEIVQVDLSPSSTLCHIIILL